MARQVCRKTCLSFVFLTAAATIAAAQNVLLGVSYSELIPMPASSVTPGQVVTGTDARGSIYLLSEAGIPGTSSYSLTKLTPAGDQVVYQTTVTFAAAFMAIDPAGNVYLAGSSICSSGPCPSQVEKLGTDGKTVLYTAMIAPDAILSGIAADSAGRAYIVGSTSSGDLKTTPGALQRMPPAGATGASQGFVVRLQANGAVDYATYIGGASPSYITAIAVDATGYAFVTGIALSAAFPTTPGAYLAASAIPDFNAGSFLVRLSPDGSSLVYSTFTDTQGSISAGLTLDPSDHAFVALNSFATASAAVIRFNAQGTSVTFSNLLPASSAEGLVVDGAGNTYVALSARANFPVQNSLASCAADGSAVLAVIDPNGNLLQATYVAGSHNTPIAVGLGPNSSVYVIASPDASYIPTRQLAGSSGSNLFLANFSRSPKAQVVQLACVANAASYDSVGISGGELVSLFGQGLGPATGTAPHVDLRSGVPNQLAGVQVTFNGIPGPLLYVQNAQINAVAPFTLPSGQTVLVCVTYNGTTTNCLTRPVLDAHPGVIMADAHYAVVVNENGTINSASNPAKVGSIVSIFATGLGALSPPQPDGAIINFPLPTDVLPAEIYTLEPTFLIGTLAEALTLQYAGPAPFQVAGVSQINFYVQATPGLFLQVGPPSVGALIQPGASNQFNLHVSPQ